MEQFYVYFGVITTLKGDILSYFLIIDDVNHKGLVDCGMSPRISNIKRHCFRILFSHNETFFTFVKSTKYQSNHFVSLLPTFQKIKNNPSSRSLSLK